MKTPVAQGVPTSPQAPSSEVVSICKFVRWNRAWRPQAESFAFDVISPPGEPQGPLVSQVTALKHDVLLKMKNMWVSQQSRDCCLLMNLTLYYALTHVKQGMLPESPLQKAKMLVALFVLYILCARLDIYTYASVSR